MYNNNNNQNSDNSDDASGAENSEHVFTVNKKSVGYRIQISVSVGGVQTKMLIDSGSDSNPIGKVTWAAMKKYTNGKKNVDNSKLYSYAPDKPLDVLST